jgi:ferredoxin-NADP reductase
LELLVLRAEPVAQDTRKLVMVRADGGDVASFEPGAHLKLWVTLEDGSRKLRDYSLVNLPDGRHYEIAVLREPDGDGGSAAMHRLHEDDRLDLETTANEFALAPDARESLLIAGGIGITPILCMARSLAARGATVELHYAARSPERMAYREEAASLGATLYFDDGDPARGVPLDQVLAEPRPDRHLYVCGPRGLIGAVLDRAGALGWPPDRLHYESFGGAVTLQRDRPIHLVLRASGRTLDVPADQSILDALVAAGLDPLFDCKRGECGMCMTAVLGGLPDHRDHALTPREREQGKLICTCVSRALTPELVLDL